ncbi:unnamed protein product [Arabidopsis halleri]
MACVWGNHRSSNPINSRDRWNTVPFPSSISSLLLHRLFLYEPATEAQRPMAQRRLLS